MFLFGLVFTLINLFVYACECVCVVCMWGGVDVEARAEL